MNIHFTDKELFKKLKAATLVKCLVGSHMYGTNNVNSDKDYLYIYATSENELLSPFKAHHQLQYKEDGVDYNFVSLHNFINNTLSGDSTINFEVIYSDILDNTSLNWLSENKNMFITYSVIRSYIGLTRRDINHYGKYKSDKERIKRFTHILRGMLYTKDLLLNKFDFKVCNEKTITELHKNEFNSGKRLKEITKITSELREDLTYACNNNTLNLGKTIKVDDGIKLNNWMIELCKSSEFLEKQKELTNFDMSLFIDSIENWVAY